MKNKGFSLIELLIVVAIIGILLSSTFGMIQIYLANSRVSNTTEEIHQALVRARVEAIKRNTDVVFTPTCVSDTCNGSWSYTVPFEEDNTKLADLPFKTSTSTVIDMSNFLTSNHSDMTITFIGSGRTRNAATATYLIRHPTLPCKEDGGDITCKRVVVLSGGQINICNPTASNTQYRC